MDKTITFTIKGREYRCSKKDVEQALKKLRPEEVKKIDTYYITIQGKRYSIKQALSVALKIGYSAFITTDAHRQLEKMGFEVGCTLYSN